MRQAHLGGMLLAALLASLPVMAQDLIVGPAGSGAPFTDINAAISASAPGQRIRVLPGTYSRGVLIDRPVELIGSPGALIQPIPTFPLSEPTGITIRNILPGQRVRVDGFSVTAFTSSRGGSSPVLVAAVSCAGQLELHNLSLIGFNTATFGVSAESGLLTIVDCAQVMVDGLFIDGGALSNGLPLSTGNNRDFPSGISVVRSVAWIQETTASGVASQVLLQGGHGRSGAGLYARDARVYCTNLIANGAQSGGGATPTTLGDGGPGLRIENSVVVLGGTRSTITGASGVNSLFGGNVVSRAGSAVLALVGATFRYANDVRLVAGTPVPGTPAPPVIAADPMALIDPLPHRLPSIRLRASPNPTNIPLELVLAGEPFIQHVRVIDFATQPAQEFPGTVGALVIPVLPTTPLYIAPLGATGTITLNSILPNLPSLVGIQIVEQAAQVINNTVWLTPPTFTTLLR